MTAPNPAPAGPDHAAHILTPPVRVDRAAAALGLDFAGDGGLMINGPRHPAEAGPDDLAIAMDKPHLAALAESRAQVAVLAAGADWQALGLKAAIFAPRARYAMAGLTDVFQHPLDAQPGVHPSAVVHPEAQLGEGVSVGPFALIERGAVIGPRARILSHVTIGAEARLGADALIHSGVRIGARCVIGDRFIAQPNAVIGADGFSFVTPEPGAVEAARAQGAWDPARGGKLSSVFARIHSLAAVRIGDDVEIGACATLDRGTLRDTSVGDGSKIDNQVQIGHNVQVGANCLLCAHVGVAGSAEIGDRVVLGGKVGVGDHLRIGHDSVIGATAAVGGNVKPGSVMLGAPAIPRDDFHRMTLAMRRLPRTLAKMNDFLMNPLGAAESKQAPRAAQDGSGNGSGRES